MITINITKAKAIGHDIRRTQRNEEFKPYDDAIAKQIPESMDTAEGKRIEIRAKYEEIQLQIDAATNPDEIKSALGL